MIRREMRAVGYHPPMELASLLPQLLSSLFRELVDGPPGKMAFIVNPGVAAAQTRCVMFGSTPSSALP